MTDNCPLCYQPLPSRDTLTLDLDTNILLSPGRPIKLTPTEAELMYAILEADPRPLTRNTLMGMLYGHTLISTADREPRIISVFVSKINAKLRKANVPAQICSENDSHTLGCIAIDGASYYIGHGVVDRKGHRGARHVIGDESYTPTNGESQ